MLLEKSGCIEPENDHKKQQSSKHDIKAKYEDGFPPNIPLELSYYIASYIEDLLTILVECLEGLRDSSTPIPLAYSCHLTHVTWLFILALPFQLIGPLNWFAIPAVMLASFAILGIFGIGWEIQSPFGYDDNDMPMDDFCRVLHKEILTIISHPMPKAESWLLSSDNHPLQPYIHLPASDLITLKEDELRSLLSKVGPGSGNETNSDFKSVTVPEAESEELRPMISTPSKN
ncbi:hypothetical protein Ocin01_18911 [Orchesella cincta]|uniref:Uncharacterized protein n=1 Tax=Orchesella cincta TaxID=48709 RepID=A0A1D2M4D2_ORCCI|nr:hypothetical protein Ocin01_18911 [Orchesella cincta]